MENIELEAKILEVTDECVKENLELMGAVEIFRGRLTAVWMQEPLTQNKLRIRDESTKGVMVEQKLNTQKANGLKKCGEIPMQVNDYNEAIVFFENLGYKIISKSIKNRVSYLIKDTEIKIEFDHYSELDGRDDIPPLLEIEAYNSEDIYLTAEKLGYRISDLKDWGVKELLEHYN